MRIYHAEMTNEIVQEYKRRRPDRKLNVLQSFGRENRDTTNFIEYYRGDINSVSLDSGTYTANKSAKPPSINISIETYTSNLKICGPKFDFYFNFDRDFTLNGFDQNHVYQRQLEGEGLHPVPVIHNIFDQQEINCYTDGNYPMIAIGSSQARTLKDAEQIVDHFYNKGMKVHLFGFTQFEHIYRLPVFSCDSSNWLMVARWDDEILYWNPKSDKFDKTEKIALETMYSKKKNLTYFTEYDYRKDLEDYLWNELKLKYGDLLDAGIFNRSMVNAHYYSLLEERITKHHLELGYSY